MDEAERDRKLEKIRKCLRMSKSANANEAGTALRHAQALMRELGIEDEAEVGMEPTSGEVIITKEAFGGCRYLNQLVGLIIATFGVDATYEAGNGISRRRANVRYIGPRSRVMMAVYAHRVIDRAIAKAWAGVRDEFNQQPGARQTFRLHFLHGIYHKVEKLVPSAVESKAIDRYKETKYGKELEPVKIKKTDLHDTFAAILGENAAAGFDIHQPMEGEGQKGIGHG